MIGYWFSTPLLSLSLCCRCCCTIFYRMESRKKGGTTFPLLLAWFNQNVIKRSSEDMERLGKVSIANSILVEKCPIAELTKKKFFSLVCKKVPCGKADFLKRCWFYTEPKQYFTILLDDTLKESR